jgi:CheY-like chemotaxis protein
MATSPSPPGDGQLRILVVEDDTANRLFFTDALSFAGFDVLALAHGLDLQQQLKEFLPHLLLLDLGLPEIDGYGLLSQVKDSALGRALPVVIVSGYAFAEDRHRALALGAAAYLVKPVPPLQLAQTVRSVLTARESAPPPS